MQPLVELTNVSKSFANRKVLNDVNLAIEQGSVLGLIGENGAGKTTIIKHILGLLKPDEGQVRVFGLDPVADPVAVLARIGYLSEEDVYPGWMKVIEIQRYMQGFYTTWDQAFAEELTEQFKLSPDKPLITFSKGQRARAGLMAALAYRPDLLLFDEPSSGLDPLVRRDILGAIIRTIADEGRTVVFSSHNLDEVDRIADQIAMVKDGRIVFCKSSDELKTTHYELTMELTPSRPVPPRFEGVIWAEGGGVEWTAIFNGDLEFAKKSALEIGGAVVGVRPAALIDIFVAYARQSSEGSQ